MAIIPEGYLDLFKKKAFANLATQMPDGSPHVTPVWIGFDGTNLLVNTAEGRIKEKNMRERKSVAISIQDPDNPYRYVAVRGRVIDRIKGVEADAHIDTQAKKYLGKDRYPWRQPGEIRIIFKIKPERVVSLG